MYVIKQDGTRVKRDITQIRKQLKPAIKGLKNVSGEELEIELEKMLKPDIQTSEITELLVMIAESFVDIDKPDWVYVAARLRLYNLYHSVKHTYLEKKVSGNVYALVSLETYLSKAMSYGKLSLTPEVISRFDLDELNEYVVSDRDNNFNSIAVDSLINRYLLKHKGVTLELPQHMFMTIAMFLAQNEEDPMYWTKTFYDMFSKFEALMATPTTSNGRKYKGNCFSCATGSNEDNIESIFDGYKSKALGGKFGTGWGWDWTRVRANGGTIDDNPGAANGVIPFLKIENDLAVAVDQLGVRLGAINVTLETWHKDILDFMKLKRNGGEDKRRAKELFTTLSCSDLFMTRVRNNESFTLFDPYDAPELSELYGEAFEIKYKMYEDGYKNHTIKFTNEPTVVSAKDLWKTFQTLAGDTGTPFLMFKDTANVGFSDINPEMGLIRNPNLCVEYLTQIKNDEIPLCNLGSVNLAKKPDNETMDQYLKRVVTIMSRALDNVIDVTYYPIPGSKETQLKRRSIGLGVVGEGEYYANRQIMYGSDEHLEDLDVLYGALAKYSDEASIALGAERGTWDKSSIYRNYVRRCLAPTSSIATLMDTTSTFEATYAKRWTEENKLGTYNVVAPRINPDNYSYYVGVYEVDQRKAIEATAIRQKHIDMGISFTLYIDPSETTGKELFDLYMLAHELKLKTVYYTRSKTVRLSDVRDADSEINCFGCN